MQPYYKDEKAMKIKFASTYLNNFKPYLRLIFYYKMFKIFNLIIANISEHEKHI